MCTSRSKSHRLVSHSTKPAPWCNMCKPHSDKARHDKSRSTAKRKSSNGVARYLRHHRKGTKRVNRKIDRGKKNVAANTHAQMPGTSARRHDVVEVVPHEKLHRVAAVLFAKATKHALGQCIFGHIRSRARCKPTCNGVQSGDTNIV